MTFTKTGCYWSPRLKRGMDDFVVGNCYIVSATAVQCRIVVKREADRVTSTRKYDVRSTSHAQCAIVSSRMASVYAPFGCSNIIFSEEKRISLLI